MTGATLLVRARRLGVTFSHNAGKLRVLDPTRNNRLKAALRRRKADVVAILEKEPAGHPVCAFFCGDPQTDRYCRECGGRWQDYVNHVTGASSTVGRAGAERHVSDAGQSKASEKHFNTVSTPFGLRPDAFVDGTYA